MRRHAASCVLRPDSCSRTTRRLAHLWRRRPTELELSQLFSALHLALTTSSAKWRKVLGQLRMEVALAQADAEATAAAVPTPMAGVDGRVAEERLANGDAVAGGGADTGGLAAAPGTPTRHARSPAPVSPLVGSPLPTPVSTTPTPGAASAGAAAAAPALANADEPRPDSDAGANAEGFLPKLALSVSKEVELAALRRTDSVRERSSARRCLARRPLTRGPVWVPSAPRRRCRPRRPRSRSCQWQCPTQPGAAYRGAAAGVARRTALTPCC